MLDPIDPVLACVLLLFFAVVVTASSASLCVTTRLKSGCCTKFEVTRSSTALDAADTLADIVGFVMMLGWFNVECWVCRTCLSSFRLDRTF